MRFNYVYGSPVEDLYPDVSISIERIYPDTAKRMLDANVNNRDEKREPIKNAIVNGEWELNGDAIRFSDEGELLDGQNRLVACVKSGKPIDTVVVRGLKKSSQITMDTGVKRSVSDYLKMHGYKDYTAVGSIGSALLHVDTLGMESGLHKRNGSDFTYTTILNYIHDNYANRIEPVVRPTKRISGHYKGFNSATIGVVLDAIRCSGAHQDDIDGFIEQLCGGLITSPTIQMFVKRLNDNAVSESGKLPQKMLGAFMVKAWNAYVTGDELRVLSLRSGGARPEKFPEIIPTSE